MDVSLYERVNSGYGMMLEERMIPSVFEKFVTPLLPVSKSLVDNYCKNKPAHTMHSAFMTLPSVLNVANWTNHVLNVVDSFRVSFKYNGTRAWLLLSSFWPSSSTAELEVALGVFSHTLPSGKRSISAILDRSGKIWLLDPCHIVACHRVWEHATFLEGELCPGSDGPASSTFIFFDCISIANASQILVRSDMDTRTKVLQRMIPHIQIDNVRMMVKEWWNIKTFFENHLQIIEEQLNNGFEASTSLSIDGLIFAHKTMVAVDGSVGQRKNQNKIFKYKPRQTVDLWVSDVGTCHKDSRRYLYAHTNGILPNAQDANLSHFKIVRAISNGGSIEYSPDDDVEQYLYSSWQYRYDIESPFDAATFAENGIHGQSVEIWLCIKSDDIYPSPNTSAMRQWLSHHGVPTQHDGLLSNSVLVEFGVSLVYKTSTMMVLNLAPLQIRRDKMFANSARVVAETCVASLYESCVSSTGLGSASGRALTLSPKMICSSLSLVF